MGWLASRDSTTEILRVERRNPMRNVRMLSDGVQIPNMKCLFSPSNSSYFLTKHPASEINLREFFILLSRAWLEKSVWTTRAFGRCQFKY